MTPGLPSAMESVSPSPAGAAPRSAFKTSLENAPHERDGSDDTRGSVTGDKDWRNFLVSDIPHPEEWHSARVAKDEARVPDAAQRAFVTLHRARDSLVTRFGVNRRRGSQRRFHS